MQPIQVDITNFQTEVIDKSEHVSVIVEFWSPTVPQCATLSAQLQELASTAGGDWILTQMNVSDPKNQQLATQLQIQGIPAVKAFQNGKLVDEFTGVPPLPQLQAWLERFGPDDKNAIVVAAREALDNGDVETASGLFKSLQEIDEEDIRPLLGFAEIAISMGDKDAATSIFEKIPETKIDDDTKGWHSKIELLIAGYLGKGQGLSAFKKLLKSENIDIQFSLPASTLRGPSFDPSGYFEEKNGSGPDLFPELGESIGKDVTGEYQAIKIPPPKLLTKRKFQDKPDIQIPPTFVQKQHAVELQPIVSDLEETSLADIQGLGVKALLDKAMPEMLSRRYDVAQYILKAVLKIEPGHAITIANLTRLEQLLE